MLTPQQQCICRCLCSWAGLAHSEWPSPSYFHTGEPRWRSDPAPGPAVAHPSALDSVLSLYHCNIKILAPSLLNLTMLSLKNFYEEGLHRKRYDKKKLSFTFNPFSSFVHSMWLYLTFTTNHISSCIHNAVCLNGPSFASRPPFWPLSAISLSPLSLQPCFSEYFVV